MSRSPPCSPHGLSTEGNGSFGEYLGQSSVFVGKKKKGGRGWRRSRPTVVIGQRQRGGGTWGGHERDILYISSVNLGKGGYQTSWKGRILYFKMERMRWEGRGGERIGSGLKLYMKATSWHQNKGRGVMLLCPFMTITKADLWKPWHSGWNIMVVLKDLVPMSFLSGMIHILFAQTYWTLSGSVMITVHNSQCETMKNPRGQ